MWRSEPWVPCRSRDCWIRLPDASGLRGVTLVRLGGIHYALGDLGRARHYLRESLTLAAAERPLHLPRGTTSFLAVISRVWLALTESETGTFPEALQLAEEAVRIARSADEQFSRVAALAALGHGRLRRGDLAEAASALEEGLEVARTRNINTWYPFCAAMLGHARTLTGGHAEALALLEDAVRRDSVRTGRNLHSLRLAWLGRPTSTPAASTRRDREPRKRSTWPWRTRSAAARRGPCAIAVQCDPPGAEAAERHYSEALTRADALGMRPLVAHCHLGLGKLHHRTGDRAKAEEHLTTASKMYREMGMSFWLARAEA
jgi:MalT-like TPR region/Tetratricopeptide repeat